MSETEGKFMKNRRQSNNSKSVGIVLLAVSIVYTLLIKLIDVAGIGPMASEVGFSTINAFFAERIGFSNLWYKITTYLGYLAILVVLFFAICGIIQLVKRKSLLKVDRGILVMGIMFVVLLAIYIIFNKVAINYRPIILPGETVLESSYPSSHTMIAVCVFGATIIEFKHSLGESSTYSIIKWVMIALMVVSVIGRLLSGAHWFTDIVGGVLISATLISFFAAFSEEY